MKDENEGSRMKHWDVEAMPIYRDAVLLVEMAEVEANRISRTRRDIANHLRRSSTSALFNLREALHEYAPDEKCRVLRIMQRETGECCAACDAIIALRRGSDGTHALRDLGRSLIRQAGGIARAALQRHPESLREE